MNFTLYTNRVFIMGQWKPLVCFLLALIMVISLLGNLFVLVAIWHSRHFMDSPSNYLIRSLVCSDLLTAILVMPPSTSLILSNAWLFGSVACMLWNVLEVLCITVTINTFCLIAIDRYVAVTRPLYYPVIVTRNRARLGVIVVWILAVVISFFPIVLGWWKTDLPAAQKCYDDDECCDLMANETYIIVSSIFAFFLPLSIMLFVYNRIFKEARHQVDTISHMTIRTIQDNSVMAVKENDQSNRFYMKGQRAFWTLSIAMGVFLLCWMPFFIAYNIEGICYECISENILTYLAWLGYSNTALNPIIYSRSPDFRKAYKRLLFGQPGADHPLTGRHSTPRRCFDDMFDNFDDMFGLYDI
uniref:beta-1 adrenergic receptor-like n=1 Tax=Myxine glutinosa TaxID=7769 RepID=UPI00358E8CDD